MAETAISEGTVISHYRVLSRIGAGGMGEVFKAEDTTLERPVALKILPPELLTDTDRVRRFVGEAKSASALNHPHIVTIHEIGQATIETSGSDPVKIHYIAMEFIEGTTLRNHIYRDTELKKLVELMSQAADGLAKAHNAGIVHRDLKPDNLMVTTDGYAKIVDFGLAKLTEKREGQSDNVEQTQEGMILGTAGYMSPEQVQGKLVDQRSDIFSFGCILYECATQSKPFQSETAIDTMHRIVFGQPQPIGDLNPEVPEELARIIRKTLAKDPDERYQTIKEIAVDLRNLARSWDQQITLGGYSLTAAPAFQTGSRMDATGMQPVASSPSMRASGSHAAPMLDEVQQRPAQIYTEGLDELPAPPRYIPITRWVVRSILILTLLIGGWLWYTHPAVEPLESGALESFPLLEKRQSEAGDEDVAWQWRSREDTAVPVRVAAVAAADPGFMQRTAPTTDDLKKEGAIAELFRSRKIPGLSPISRSVAKATLIEPGDLVKPIRQYVVSFDLESSLPKPRILELYINTLEFNPRLIGVDAAAQHYFGKSAGSLNDREAALLMASVGAPEVNLKDPPDWIVTKQEAILEAMKKD